MAILLVSASSALAAEVHPLKATFGSFSSPSGIGIDKANGNVFVAAGSPSNTVEISGPTGGAPSGVASPFKIEGFAFGGEPSGVAVDNSATSPSKGALYVTDVQHNSVKKFVLSGSEEYELKEALAASFGEPLGVAVDSKGNVFVGDYGSSSVVVISPTGTQTARINVESSVGRPSALAFDSAGNLYVQQYGGGAVYKFAANGSGEIEPSTTPTQIVTAGATGIAVDQSTDALYVAMGDRLDQYSSAGTLASSSGAGSLTATQRVAVSPTTGEIYVVDRGQGKVAIFDGSIVVVPNAATKEATQVKRTSAALNGTVNAAGGANATCEFQYTSAPQGFEGASTAPCVPAGPFSGSANEAVSAEISGLSAETSYRFRLVGSNANGSNPGPTLSFETASAVTLKTGNASNLAPTAATLNGTITPEGIEVESCAFEYGEEEGVYGETVPCAETPAQIGTGGGPVTVHADVSGLTQIHVYHFRLVAKNSFGTTKGSDSSFRTPGPPEIHAVSISDVTLSTATLEGLINPDGEVTTYHFDYVSEADFKASEWANATEVPGGGKAIGSGNDDVAVAHELNGLMSLTTYHVRLVASNAKGTEASDDEVFTTYNEESPGLPDSRAYEQATPVSKGGANPLGSENLVKAASNGSGITFFVTGGMPGIETEGSQGYPLYLSSRGLSSWSTQGLFPPASQGATANIRGFDENITQTYVVQSKSPNEPATLYQRDNSTHSLRKIADDVRLEERNAVLGSSADGSELVLELRNAPGLTPPAASAEGRNTFVWDKATGVLSVAGVLNDGHAPAGGATPGSYVIDSNPSNYTKYEHPISTDGSRVYFTSITSHQIYMRLHPTRPQSTMVGNECSVPADACTVAVSAPEAGVTDPNGQQPATLMFATLDGSRAFFTSPGKLTADATTGPNDEGRDLYLYDTKSKDLADLTVDSADPAGAEVQGILGASDDGSYVYFAANGVLAPGASPGNCRNEVFDFSGTNDNYLQNTIGTCNLYVWHDGEITFISPQRATGPEGRSDAENWMRKPNFAVGEKTARVTPDGGTLLFRSMEQLTSYDNDGFAEFYRYSADVDDLLCVSCNPSGKTPVGAASAQSINLTWGETPPPTPVQTRNLSADGKRIFFDSPDKLVSGDINGEAGCPTIQVQYAYLSFSCQDVYEWEANGSGSCHSEAQNGGCLYLISSGTSPRPSFFADASITGDDAFIFTIQPLVRQDQDELVDVYDARVGGGIAAQNAPPPPICEGESCKPGGMAPPPTSSPGSASFSAAGNPKPVRHHKKKGRHKGRKHSKAHHGKPSKHRHGGVR